MVVALYTDAPYYRYLALRILGELGLYTVYVIARRNVGSSTLSRNNSATACLRSGGYNWRPSGINRFGNF